MKYIYSLIVFFFILSIPWSFSPLSSANLLMGIPVWVISAFGCYFIIAILIAVAWKIV